MRYSLFHVATFFKVKKRMISLFLCKVYVTICLVREAAYFVLYFIVLVAKCQVRCLMGPVKLQNAAFSPLSPRGRF